RALHRQLPFALDELLEVDAVEVLHDEVEGAVRRRAGVGDIDDVGVADLRGGAGLAPEPLDDLLAVPEARVQDLDGQAPPDVDVARFVDAAHRALAAQALEQVAAAQRRPDARVLACQRRADAAALVAARVQRAVVPQRRRFPGAPSARHALRRVVRLAT